MNFQSSQMHAYSGRLHLPQAVMLYLTRKFCGLASALERSCTTTM